MGRHLTTHPAVMPPPGSSPQKARQLCDTQLCARRISAAALGYQQQVIPHLCIGNGQGRGGAVISEYLILLRALGAQFQLRQLLTQLPRGFIITPLPAQLPQWLHYLLSPLGNTPLQACQVFRIKALAHGGQPGAVQQQVHIQIAVILQRQAGLGHALPGVMGQGVIPQWIVHSYSIWLPVPAAGRIRSLMIILRDISLRRGSKQLLHDANVTIQPGQRLALIGANGSGKSSLLSLLLGELGADHGTIEGMGKLRLSHMAQEVKATTLAAAEYVWRGDSELAGKRDRLQQLEEQGEFERAAAIHSQLEEIDGYSAERKAERLLQGLGFAEDAAARPVSDFSGGWRIRLNLARALMTPSDILLLDEPTNHLDLDATLWLQQWLQQYPGTLLMISHDRDFIDATCERILHIEQQQLFTYKGNYSDFERQRAERLANQQASYEKQQRRISEIDDFVRRFRYKATKAKQAQSRLKELERMQTLAPAHLDSPFDFSFPPPQRSSDPLLRLDDAVLGYPGREILRGVNLQLRPGSRYGLLGKNGAGKSTLLKSLVGELPLLGGKRSPGEHCSIGYFDQQQLEVLDLDASAALHLQRLSPQAREQDILNFLGGFNFRGDAATTAVAPFSGGEKARLALAMVVWQKPNLLVLDEPTNHLDLEMRHAMEVALQAYEGALILVSHDRHMLRNSAEDLLLVHDGRVEEYREDLGGYERWILSSYRQGDTPAQSGGDNSRREKRQQAAAQREKLRPLTKELNRTESDMSRVERELSLLQETLADAALYSEARKAELAQLLQAEGGLKAQAEQLEERWLELQQSVEDLESP